MEGDITANVSSASCVMSNCYGYLNLNLQRVQNNQAGGSPANMYMSMNGSTNIWDNNLDGNIQSEEIIVHPAFGDSRKIFMRSGERMQVKFGGSFTGSNDSLTISNSRIMIKRLNL